MQSFGVVWKSHTEELQYYEPGCSNSDHQKEYKKEPKVLPSNLLDMPPSSSRPQLVPEAVEPKVDREA